MEGEVVLKKIDSKKNSVDMLTAITGSKIQAFENVEEVQVVACEIGEGIARCSS